MKTWNNYIAYVFRPLTECLHEATFVVITASSLFGYCINPISKAWGHIISDKKIGFIETNKFPKNVTKKEYKFNKLYPTNNLARLE